MGYYDGGNRAGCLGALGVGVILAGLFILIGGGFVGSTGRDIAIGIICIIIGAVVIAKREDI